MNKIVELRLRENYPDLAVPTIKSYSSNIVKAMRLIDSIDLDDLFKKMEDIIVKVKEKYEEIGTRKCKYSSCVVYIKTLLTEEDEEKNNLINAARNRYNEEIDLIKKDTEKKLLKYEKTKHEEDAWLSVEEKKKINIGLLKKVKKRIKNLEDLKHLRNAVIFSFYLDLASRCEVASAKIMFLDDIEDIEELDKEYNYIILDNSSRKISYIMNKHKNANRKGSYTVSLSSDLYDLFERYTNELKKFKIEDWFVFNDKGDKNMSYHDLSVLYSSFGDIINKKISIRVNRKIYTSEKVKIGELIDLSNRMGHSLKETLNVYSKR
jgi:hypothetical protein